MLRASAKPQKPCWPFQTNRDSDQAQGLVGWWPGGPAGGPRLFDRSGKGNHGTLTNFAAPFTATSGWAAGKDGGRGAVYYDGSNDKVAISVPGGYGAFTATAWYYWDSANTTNVQPVVFKLSSQAMQVASVPASSSMHMRWFDASAAIDGTTVVSGRSWHHLVWSRDAGNTVRFYIDAIQDATTGSSSPVTQTIDAFGAFTGSAANQMLGLLEDLRFYNRALSAAEVAALYAPSTRWQLRYQPGRRVWFAPAAAAGGASIFGGGILRSRTIAGGAA